MRFLPGVAGVLLVSLAVAALLVLGPVGSTVQCDGALPTLMIEAQDCDGGGCAEVLPTPEAPPNADWSPYCLGYCIQQDPDH